MTTRLPIAGPGGVSLDYLTRCHALTHRGLSPALAHDLQATNNLALLCELEDSPDATLVRLSEFHAARDAAAIAITTTVAAAVHLGVAVGLTAAPLLWEGDQA